MGSKSTTGDPPMAAHADAFYHCADCSYCVDAVWDERQLEHVCPTLSHHSPALSYSGRGYMTLARALFEGEEFPLADLAERVFTCTSCGNCERVCPIGLSPRNINLALRETLAAHDAAPESLQNYANELLNARKSIKNAEILEFPLIADNPPELTLDLVDTLFLPGCEAPARAPGEVAACYSIVKEISPRTSLLAASAGERDACCGEALNNLGFTADAETTKQQLIAQSNIYPRLTDIVHLRASCSTRLDAVPRQHSFISWLGKMLDDGSVAVSVSKPADHLVCLNTCQDDPIRDQIQALFQRLGVTPQNDDFTSGFPLCCGAGGGMTRMAPESAGKMAKAKIDSIDADANITVVVPDAICLAHLREQTSDTRPDLTLYGLGEYLRAHFKFEVRR